MKRLSASLWLCVWVRNHRGKRRSPGKELYRFKKKEVADVVTWEQERSEKMATGFYNLKVLSDFRE